MSAFQVHISDHDIHTHGDAPNVLVIGEVVRVRLAEEIREGPGFAIDPKRLQAVGRLGGPSYAPLDSVVDLGRPKR